MLAKQLITALLSRLNLSKPHGMHDKLNEPPIAIDNDRELFYRLFQPDTSQSVIHAARDYLTQVLADTNSQKEFSARLRFQGDVATLRQDVVALRQTLQTNVSPNVYSVQGLVRQYAPMGLLGMSWLQSVSHAAQAYTEPAALLFRLYSGSLGFQQHTNHRINCFKQALTQLDLGLPDPTTWLFSTYPGFVDEAFRLPVISLCLARLPDTYRPELLGFTIAHCCELSRVMHFLHSKANELSGQPDALRKFLKYSASEDDSALIFQAVEICLQSIPVSELELFKQRLINGIWLYVHAETGIVDVLTTQGQAIQQCWTDILKEDAVSQTITDLSMSDKQRDTAELSLYGKPLKDWFSDEPVLADKYLQSLFNSSEATHHKAAMRRYFSDSSIFAENIDSETSSHHVMRTLVSRYQALNKRNSSLSHDNETSIQRKSFSAKPIINDARARANIEDERYDSRRLYHELLNLESHPQCLLPAYQFVEQQLKQSASALQSIKPEHLRLIEYSQSALEQLIHTIHEAEARQKKPFKPPPKLSKQAYLWGIRQFAPVLLVDGSWLQNSAMAGNLHHVISRYLFRIYADEIGDGHCDWNHANVFRELLRKTAIELPEFTSREFSLSDEFVNGAFDLPVFFLAISQFPSRFQPEIIGLNLAIELSGLGSTYQRLVDEMEYWKLDSTIVSLHLSIDNLTSGHAALAQDAVVMYLDQILNQLGYVEMQHHWQRIWTGYLALQTVPKRFKRALIMGYVCRFIFRADQLFKINR